MDVRRGLAVAFLTLPVIGGLAPSVCPALGSPPVAPTEALSPEEERAKFRLPAGFAPLPPPVDAVAFRPPPPPRHRPPHRFEQKVGRDFYSEYFHVLVFITHGST